MTDELVNWIRIEGDTLQGSLSSLSFDIDVSGEIIESDCTRTFRLMSTSPRGRSIEVGACWQWSGTETDARYSLTLYTGHGRWPAKLVPYPDRDEPSLYLVQFHDQIQPKYLKDVG